MTLNEFKEKMLLNQSDPEVVRLILSKMAALPANQLYKDGVTASANGKPYREHALNFIAFRLNEDAEELGEEAVGGKMIPLIKSFPDDADIAFSKRMCKDYYDMLVCIASLPTGFVPAH